MHIGLFFGSFNPVHTGHLIIANCALQHTDIDKVWFVLSPHNPLKESHSLLNEYDRLHLLQLAVEDNPDFRASNVEFSLPRPSFTIDTLAYLQEKFPYEQFSIIMGSDSYANLPRWKNWEQLAQRCRFIVYLRPGFEVIPHAHTEVTLLQAPLLDISATYIRTQVRQNKSIRYLTPDVVTQHIEENRYYKG